MIAFPNEAKAVANDRIIAYITWQNLSQRWPDTTKLASDPTLDMLTDVIAPAVNIKSATSPTIIGMYNGNLETLRVIANAGHSHGCLVGPYLYTDSSGKYGPTLTQLVSAGTQNALAANIRDFLTAYDLDGITLDPEDGSSAATLNIVLKAIRNALPGDKYIDITGRPYSAPNINIESAGYLRYIQVMTYDMGWSPNTAGYPHSSFDATAKGMAMWSDAGFSKTQLVMGIPTYGRTAYAATLNPKQESLQYYEILSQQENAFNLDYATLTAPSGLKRDFWWGSAATAKSKTRWNKDNGYAGVMIFALGYDKLNDSKSLVRAIYDELNTGGPSASPLAVSVTGTSGLGTTGVTLNAQLTGMGSSTSVAVNFEFGLNAAYGQILPATPQVLNNNGSFSATVSNLNPNTEYHFRAVARGESTIYTNDQTFKTLPLTSTPSISTLGATGVKTTTAVLNGNLISKGNDNSVNLSFEYGTSTRYGKSVQAIPATLSAPGNFSASVVGLATNTVYHFRTKLVGSTIVYGNDMTFRTGTSISPLSLETMSLPSSQVGSQYEYTLIAKGGTTPYTWTISGGNLPPGIVLNSYTGILSGIPTSANMYTVTIELKDSTYPTNTSAIRNFTIAIDVQKPNPAGNFPGGNSGGGITNQGSPNPKSPKIVDLKSENTTRTGTIISWENDQECVTTLMYSPANSENWKSVTNDSPVLLHSFKIENLTPKTTYKFILTSKNKSTNLSTSENLSIATGFNPPVFSASPLSISPEIVTAEEQISISTIMTNLGDLEDSQEIVLTISSENISQIYSQPLSLAPGESKGVEFIYGNVDPGQYTASIGNHSSSFSIEPELKPSIDFFKADPLTDPKNKINSVVINYAITNPGKKSSNTQLVIGVLKDGNKVDNVTLFTGEIGPGSSITGTFDYVPADLSGGTYTFESTAYSSNLRLDTAISSAQITCPPKTAVFRWYILAIIIGFFALISALTIVLVMYRGKELVGMWMENTK